MDEHYYVQERERQRVKNVIDVFSHQRNQLLRILNMNSKVETLQHDIKYIKYLQNLLQDNEDNDGYEMECNYMTI